MSTRCVNLGTNLHNAQLCAIETKEIIIKRIAPGQKEVEDCQASCVTNGTFDYLSTFTIIKSYCPKLILMGSASHVIDLLGEDLCDSNSTYLLKQVLNNVNFCCKTCNES